MKPTCLYKDGKTLFLIFFFPWIYKNVSLITAGFLKEKTFEIPTQQYKLDTHEAEKKRLSDLMIKQKEDV